MNVMFVLYSNKVSFCCYNFAKVLSQRCFALSFYNSNLCLGVFNDDENGLVSRPQLFKQRITLSTG